MLFVVKNICEKNFKNGYLGHPCDENYLLLSPRGVMYNWPNNKLIVTTEMMHVHHTILCVDA